MLLTSTLDRTPILTCPQKHVMNRDTIVVLHVITSKVLSEILLCHTPRKTKIEIPPQIIVQVIASKEVRIISRINHAITRCKATRNVILNAQGQKGILTPNSSLSLLQEKAHLLCYTLNSVTSLQTGLTRQYLCSLTLCLPTTTTSMSYQIIILNQICTLHKLLHVIKVSFMLIQGRKSGVRTTPTHNRKIMS